MKTKSDIVADWLPRYTGTPLKQFGKHILLVNFSDYVRRFSRWHGVPLCGKDRPMLNATADGITIINFGTGDAHAEVDDGNTIGGGIEHGAILAAQRHTVPARETPNVVTEVHQQDVLAELLERSAGVTGKPVGNDVRFRLHLVAAPVSHRLVGSASQNPAKGKGAPAFASAPENS